MQLAVDDTQNKAWVEESKSSFGYKMMLKMGWNEKTGLGKAGDGAVAHIRIKKRVENVGAWLYPTHLQPYVCCYAGIHALHRTGRHRWVWRRWHLSPVLQHVSLSSQSLCSTHPMGGWRRLGAHDALVG